MKTAGAKRLVGSVGLERDTRSKDPATSAA